MQIKFLKSIVEHLTNKQASEIVDLLASKKDVNEFLIAKKLGLTINQTRNILYTLSDFGLVSFIRKKDKRKGWYIYYWTLNISKSLSFLEKKLKSELENLENQLKSRKEKRYYFCKICNIEVNEETALLNDFKCSECEEVYELRDNLEKVKDLEKQINRLKREIELVSEERQKAEDKVIKKKKRKIKKIENEKIKKRKTEREMRKKEREKNKKKENKKIKKTQKKVKKKKSIKKTSKTKKRDKKATKSKTKKKTKKKKKK